MRIRNYRNCHTHAYAITARGAALMLRKAAEEVSPTPLLPTPYPLPPNPQPSYSLPPTPYPPTPNLYPLTPDL
jgi:hypothetical protein